MKPWTDLNLTPRTHAPAFRHPSWTTVAVGVWLVNCGHAVVGLALATARGMVEFRTAAELDQDFVHAVVLSVVLNIACGYMDDEGRLLTDRMLGVVVVFKEQVSWGLGGPTFVVLYIPTYWSPSCATTLPGQEPPTPAYSGLPCPPPTPNHLLSSRTTSTATFGPRSATAGGAQTSASCE